MSSEAPPPPLPPPPQLATDVPPLPPAAPIGPSSVRQTAAEYAASIRATNPNPPSIEAPTLKVRKERRKCCVKGCNNHVRLQRVPPYPSPLPAGATKARQITHAKRILKRQEFLERLGRQRDDSLKDLRYCVNHKMEKQQFSLSVTIKDKDGLETETVTVPLEFSVPINVTQNPPTKGRRKKCCVKGCNNHFSLKRVPGMPNEIPAGSSKARQITRAKKVFKHAEFLKRLGVNPSDVNKNSDLRFCHNHKMENKNWTFTVSIVDEHGAEVESVESTAEFEVPAMVEYDGVDGDKKEAAVPVPQMEEALPEAMTIEALETGQPSSASAFEPPVATVGKQKQDPSEPSSELVATSMTDDGQPLESIML